MSKANLFFLSLLVALAFAYYDKPCEYDFFCDPNYLLSLGQSKAFTDSKTIVDLVMKDDFANFKEAFDNELFAEGALDNATKVREIIFKYFDPPGNELAEVIPDDWIPDPFGDKIKDANLRRFALDLNGIWKNLTRRAANSSDKGQRSTFLQMPHESVVPGGRFREIYYWDSYWTIQGLLACNMNRTVKNMIQNMLSNVETYGFVPNGGRVYYTKRSQPPFLTLMMNEYLLHTSDNDFIKDSLATLDKEYNFWLAHRQIRVRNHHMFQYRTKMAYERPESFWEDYKTSEEAVIRAYRSKGQVLIDISSAAESGWDFSSRWLAYSGPHTDKLYSIRTTKIIPVCLNSILCKVARTLQEFHGSFNSTEKANFYKSEVERLAQAIDEILYDPVSMSWFDFDIEENAKHYKMYMSNFFPLWANCHSRSKEDVFQMIKQLNLSGYMDFEGGFATSNTYTKQQWDFPNAWSPLQEIMIEALFNQEDQGKHMALDLMQRWIFNNYYTYSSGSSKNMYEKYSAVRLGYPGEGGEYDVQVGFGWSNGVALKYITKYGQYLSTQN
ncbi:hypothetical protein GJ496_006250 [Pomphorhynchus laevis]|nr:hypothetical protein GJ496_006250 [Pomphorhynchus laevis]